MLLGVHYGVLLAALLCHSIGDVSAQTVSYTCHVPPNGGTELFRLMLRVNPAGVTTTVTGIKMYEAIENPTFVTAITDTNCLTSTANADTTFSLDVTIDTGGPTCGKTLGGTVHTLAFKLEGTEIFYVISCDTTTLVSDTVTQTSFTTTAVSANKFSRFNPTDIKFQVVEADSSYGPTSVVELNQNLFIRVIQNQDFREIGPDNWGYTFHTAFGRNAGGTLLLQITTPGLGTEVHITGNTLDIYTKVKRNEAAEVEITNANFDFQATTSTSTLFAIDVKGLKIEATHDRIGVRVISRVGQRESSFVALPDDVLDESDNTYDYSLTGLGGTDAEILIVGTEAVTTVTLDYNTFDISGLLFVQLSDGVGSVRAFGTDDIFTLDENDVLTIRCSYDDCQKLDLTADKRIAVISSTEDSAFDGADPEDVSGNTGHYSTQLIPDAQFGDEYVVIFPTGLLFAYAYHVNEDVTSLGIDYGGTVTLTPNADMWYSSADFTFAATPPEAFETTLSAPAGLYLAIEALAANDDPVAVSIPSVTQWGVYNYFYAKTGAVYDLYVVAFIGQTVNVQVDLRSFGDSATTLAGIGGGLGTPAVVPIASGTNRFEYTKIPDMAATSDGLVSLRSGSNNKPFMVLIIEKDASGNQRDAFLPFGVRYPECGVTGIINHPFGQTYYTGPGDVIDNDCDGLLNEETNNGADDDGDNLIDEDLALGPADNCGIYVESLIMDHEVTFDSGNEQTIISGGCNTNTGVASTIGDFTRNTALDSVFNKLWVLDSDVFNAFKYINCDDIYFRVTLGLCYYDFTLCENSCSARRKRSAQESESDLQVDLHMHFDKNGARTVTQIGQHQGSNSTKTDQATKHPCENNLVYWVHSSMLLLIIIIEFATVTWMFMLKRKVA